MKPSRLIGLVTGGLLQSAAVVLLARGAGLLPVVALTFAGAAAWGWGVAGWLPTGQRAAWWLPAAAAAAGPGIGLLLAATLVRLLRARPADWSGRHYVVWKEITEAAEGDGATPSPAATSVVAILHSPDSQQRRNAVLALRDLEPKVAVPLLRKGLQDSDEQVRIFSQNILSKMMERLEASLRETRLPSHPGPGDVQTIIELAEHYHEMVFLGVAGDDETSALYLRQAISLLEQAHALAPANPRISYLAARYSLRRRDAAAAAVWLDRAATAGNEAARLLPWRAELAFLRRDWATLRELLGDFRESGAINAPLGATVAPWLGPRPGRT